MSDRGHCVLERARRAVARALLAAGCVVAASAQPDPQTLAQEARQAMAERRFAQAADLYAELAKSFPNQPSLQANLGMALHLSGRDREAIAPLQMAVSALSSSFQAHFFLGASLTRLGESAESVAPLRQAVRLNPKHPFARALLGDSLEAVGKFSEAVGSWRALRELEQANPYAHAGLVRSYEQLAAQAMDGLKERDPESVYVVRLLAESRMSTAQYPSALYLFRQALEREPGVRSLHESVAAIYERTGRTEWAAIERRRSATLPESDCSSSETAECLFVSGRYEAVPSASSTASSEDIFWSARAYAKLAEASFAKLTSLGESVDQLTLVADILASQQQFSNAADACRRALAIRQGDGGLERQLAELLYLARRTTEARPLLERFLRSDARDPRWPAMMGNLLAEEQEFEKAIPLLETAVALPGGPPGARLDLGRSYLALGRSEEAAMHLSASLGMDTDGSVHYQLAQAYQRMGMRDEAREALATYQALDARSRRDTEASASLEITAPE